MLGAGSLYLMIACAPTQRPTNEIHVGSSAVLDSALRTELLMRYERDQSVRQSFTSASQAGRQLDSIGIARLAIIDAANSRWLSQVIAQHGWPGRSLVGVDGANAAFTLLQHADQDTALQVRALPAVQRAFAAGEAEGQHVALLTDRIAVARMQPQIYGTQANVVDGRIVLRPIAESVRVDVRRASMGLPPLAEYLRLLELHYLGKPSH